MIASALPVYADFDFFSLPDRSRLAKKFGTVSKDDSFLKYPKSEISFIEKCVAERTLKVLLIKDVDNAIIFLPVATYYNTGFCVAFKPGFTLDSVSFSALGDLKSDLCISPAVSRLLVKKSDDRKCFNEQGILSFFSQILNFNAFVSRGVDFDMITHEIASKCFSCVSTVTNLCGCSFDVKRDYPTVACVSNFDYGMFGLFVLCAVDAVFKNEFSKMAEFSVFYEEGSGLFFEFKFFGSVGKTFLPLFHAAEQRRMPILAKSTEGEICFAFSPMRPEVALLELKDDHMVIKVERSKRISYID